MKKVFASLLFVTEVLLPTKPSFAYGFLDLFVSPDLTSYRTSSVSSIDLIQSPKWNTSSPIEVVLCTGGTGYSNANISFVADQEAELLADINTALNTWETAGNGSQIDFAVATSSAGCGPNYGTAYATANGQNEIFFNKPSSLGLDSSVLGFTLNYYSMVSGEAKIVESDIFFSTDIPGPTKFATSGKSDGYSFLGVLTHELGHFLGISHSGITDDNSGDPQNTWPTMFAAVGSFNQSEQIESLTRDDAAAVMSLYSTGSNLSGTTYGGSISGTVYRESGEPQRGAQVTAFSIESNTSLAGAFTGMRGTQSSPDGTYTINGLPLDHEFIVIVEPIHRPGTPPNGVHPNYDYSVYNTPISVALSDQGEGYRSFPVEAYPDVDVVDVRLESAVNVSPGLTNAQVFELSSGSPSQSGIDFYLSNLFEAPNDLNPSNVSLTFLNESVVNNGNPLQLKIEVGSDLNKLLNPSLSLTATNSSGSLNWSSSAPTISYEGNCLIATFESPVPSNGSYDLTATLSDDRYGDFSGSKSLNVSGWSSRSAASTSSCDTVTGTSGGGGGGCHLSTSNTPSANPILYILLVFSFAFILRHTGLTKDRQHIDKAQVIQ